MKLGLRLKNRPLQNGQRAMNQHQVDVLALVKILGYFKQNDTPERIAELERFFNGFL